MIHRLLKRLFGRGWGKDVTAGIIYDEMTDPPNLLSPCALASNRPHFYGRKDGRVAKCLRCGHERQTK